MATAIISRVNELTQILAVIVVVAHCAVIFWPRKPINVPTDDNGMPILWHNEDGSRQDIACVWQDSSPKGTTTASLVGAEPMASFSETVRPLGAKAAEAARSVA